MLKIRHLCHASSSSRDQQRNIDGHTTTFSTAGDLGRTESTDPTDRHEMQCRMSLRVFFSSVCCGLLFVFNDFVDGVAEVLSIDRTSRE